LFHCIIVHIASWQAQVLERTSIFRNEGKNPFIVDTRNTELLLTNRRKTMTWHQRKDSKSIYTSKKV
jgi:hypothetical protein